MKTPNEIRALIAKNLESGSGILAEKHREVELEILNYAESVELLVKDFSVAIKKNTALTWGTFIIGDVATSQFYLISFPDVGTNNYRVSGSFVSKSVNPNNDNDLFYSIREKTKTSFKLSVRELSGSVSSMTGYVQNVDFDWEIKKIS